MSLHPLWQLRRDRYVCWLFIPPWMGCLSCRGWTALQWFCPQSVKTRGTPMNVVSFKHVAVLGGFPDLCWFTTVSPLPSPELALRGSLSISKQFLAGFKGRRGKENYCDRGFVWFVCCFFKSKMSFLNKTNDFVSPDYLFYKERRNKQRSFSMLD